MPLFDFCCRSISLGPEALGSQGLVRGSGRGGRGGHVTMDTNSSTGMRTGTKETPPWRKKSVSFSPHATMVSTNGIYHVLASQSDGPSLVSLVIKAAVGDVICKRDGRQCVKPVDIEHIKQLVGGSDGLLNIVEYIYCILRRYKRILSAPGSSLRLISSPYNLTHEARVVIEYAIRAFEDFVRSTELWSIPEIAAICYCDCVCCQPATKRARCS
jgi:hypothetical protein